MAKSDIIQHNNKHTRICTRAHTRPITQGNNKAIIPFVCMWYGCPLPSEAQFGVHCFDCGEQTHACMQSHATQMLLLIPRWASKLLPAINDLHPLIHPESIALLTRIQNNFTRMMPSAQPVTMTFLESHSCRCVKKTHRMSGCGPQESSVRVSSWPFMFHR